MEPAHDPGGDPGLDVLGRHVDVDQVVEVEGCSVQIEGRAIGVGDHDEVTGGFDDPREPVVVGDHVLVPVFGGAGLGHVDGVDRQVGILGVVQAVLEVHPGPAPGPVGRTESDVDPVGGAGAGHDVTPPRHHLGVVVDAPTEPVQDGRVVAVELRVAEEVEEPGIDEDEVQIAVDAGDQTPRVTGPERVGTSRRPGAVLGEVTQDHASTQCSHVTAPRGKRVSPDRLRPGR